MDFASFGELFSTLQMTVVALGLCTARLFGILTILPVFTRLGLSGLVRGGVAIALALPLAPALFPSLTNQGPGAMALAALLIKETLLGVIIGVVFSGPFWIAEIAGELIDQQRQSESAVIPDPSQQSESGITATLLTLTMVVVFFTAGGMQMIFDGVIASYEVWPAMAWGPHFTADGGLQVLGLLDDVFRAGIVVASPLVIAMVFGEIALALVSRVAPQLNVFDLSLSVKGLIYTLGLPIYATVLIGYLRSSLSSIVDIGSMLKHLTP